MANADPRVFARHFQTGGATDGSAGRIQTVFYDGHAEMRDPAGTVITSTDTSGIRRWTIHND